MTGMVCYKPSELSQPKLFVRSVVSTALFLLVCKKIGKEKILLPFQLQQRQAVHVIKLGQVHLKARGRDTYILLSEEFH